ncbi:thioredoxin-dependent thiol peroxidase [Algoriphagus sp. oki45]|uniref:peroxiredoxin n=1 Tax=Algoriphagus sp. oki45 TaxID=3067294 RepID=UPI0027EB59B3|nr:thioredoxin-dependent thiol peroxidase [Algoriphagus sp. oki45]
MALKKGTTAPDFTLPATSDQTITLSKDLKGKAVVLYFYPKDFTPGCTAEACEFRDQFEGFRDLDIPIFGISRDDIPTHEKFKKAHRLPFDLLSDSSGKVCKVYDALIPLIKMPKRVTYLLDENHQIAGVFEGLFENKAHAQSMLKLLEK